MDSFSNRFKKALETRHLTAADFSRMSGTSEATISQYKKGLYVPKQKRLEQYSNLLKVSIPWLMGADVPMEIDRPAHNDYSESDIELLNLFQKLTPTQKQDVLIQIALKLSENKDDS